MRIIAGSARGRRLRAPAGLAVRPTPDRVREALFDILGRAIEGAAFLDLYAGSGAVGLEALSRGAARAILVEAEAAHAAVVRANLHATGLAGGEVVHASVRAALARLARRGERFDLVYLDPPYAEAGERAACLRRLAEGDLLSADPCVVAEIPTRERPSEPEGLRLERRARYGDTSLVFYRRAAGAPPPVPGAGPRRCAGTGAAGPNGAPGAGEDA